MSSRLHILYLGKSSGMSLQRANTLWRMGHEVCVIDPHAFLPRKRFLGRAVSKLIYEVRAHIVEPFVRIKLLTQVRKRSFDLACVDSGELLGPTTIHALHAYVPTLIVERWPGEQ